MGITPAEPEPRLLAVAASTSPITIIAATPSPKPPLRKSYPQVKPKPTPLGSKLKSSGMAARGVDCSKTPNAFGCCLDVLKLSGDLPDAKVSRYGTAASVPVQPLTLEEGEETIVITNEGPVKHAAKIKKVEGKLKVVKEGGMGFNSEGREVLANQIKGEVIESLQLKKGGEKNDKKLLVKSSSTTNKP